VKQQRRVMDIIKNMQRQDRYMALVIAIGVAEMALQLWTVLS